MRNSAPRGRRDALAALLCWPLAARGAAAQPAPLLPPALQRVIAGSGLPAASFGVYIAALDAARPLAALNAEEPFVMASTAKIVTSLAALDLLGPRYRWRTHAFASGPIEAGRLHGDLLIVGGGDPRLSTSELRGWLAGLRAQGLREIRGDIVVDRSAFHLRDEEHAGTPLPAPDRPHHVRPDAFTLDAGVLHVHVRGSRGRLADVRTEPPLPGIPLVNRVAAAGGCHAGARWVEEGGQAQLRVEGAWGAHCGARELTLVPPAGAGLVARAVAGVWLELGGTLRGRAREGDLSAGSAERARLPLYGSDGDPLLPLATHLSPPLPEVVHEVNKSSNNLLARHLMLSLSRGFPLHAATLAKARQRVREWLHGQGVAAQDIQLDNGSGLSRAERARPRALAQLLARAWTARESRAFVASLPVAGVDGTLAHRLQGGAAAGQAFLKTGTLLDARALAGYVRARSGRVHTVAALVNHPEAARARPALDALIEWVARSG